LAVAYWAVNAVKKAANAFSLDIVGYGMPRMSGFILTVPLQVKFTNPTSIPLKVDQLVADVYVLKGTQFVQAAQINQPVSVPAGDTVQTIIANLDLRAIFGGNLIDTAQFISQIISAKVLSIRTTVTAYYSGISLPAQTFTNELTF
jgi:hypothetical protein